MASWNIQQNKLKELFVDKYSEILLSEKTTNERKNDVASEAKKTEIKGDFATENDVDLRATNDFNVHKQPRRKPIELPTTHLPVTSSREKQLRLWGDKSLLNEIDSQTKRKLSVLRAMSALFCAGIFVKKRFKKLPFVVQKFHGRFFLLSRATIITTYIIFYGKSN